MSPTSRAAASTRDTGAVFRYTARLAAWSTVGTMPTPREGNRERQGVRGGARRLPRRLHRGHGLIGGGDAGGRRAVAQRGVRHRAGGATSCAVAALLVLALLPPTAHGQQRPPRSPPAGAGETVQQLTDRLLSGYSQRTSPNVAMAERLAATTGAQCSPPEPNMVTAQIYVTKFGNIDQKVGSFDVEGYFRLWWNDPRLAFDAGSSCIDSIKLLDGPDQIWVPDFYFPPSKTHVIGARFHVPNR